MSAASVWLKLSNGLPALIDAHYTNVGTTPKRTFDPQDRVISVWIWSRSSGVHVHNAEFEVAQGTGDLGTAIDRDLFTGDRVNSDLATEKQQVL